MTPLNFPAAQFFIVSGGADFKSSVGSDFYDERAILFRSRDFEISSVDGAFIPIQLEIEKAEITSQV